MLSGVVSTQRVLGVAGRVDVLAHEVGALLNASIGWTRARGGRRDHRPLPAPARSDSCFLSADRTCLGQMACPPSPSRATESRNGIDIP